MRAASASLLVALLVAAPAPARADTATDGRAARISGIALWVASGVALAVGAVAWYEKGDYENRAHQDLAALVPDSANAPMALAWFASPNCSPPATVIGATAQYRSDCTSGQAWSNAGTALFALAPALALAGTISYVVGARPGERPAARVALTPTGLRLNF
jgi:hypothetical protein